MKVNQAVRLSQARGVLEEVNYRILATPKAYQSLSSTLYSDKISTVLREIGSNAADAHAAAGIPDTPFEVTLPTLLDPTLRIRDFGPGLTHEEVFKIYPAYFYTTKDQSDEFNGAHGVGAKSPFCYVDQFALTVAQNGRKRVYSARVASAENRVIGLMGEEESPEWPQGLEVSVPVRPDDIEAFRQKAQEVFQWFRVLPKIMGAPAIKRFPFKLELENVAFASDYLFRVLMGDVCYPLDMRKLAPNSELAAGFARGVCLKMPIGSVTVTLSREQLEYDPRTVKSLTAALARVLLELLKYLSDQFAEATTFWDGAVAIKGVARKCGLLEHVFRHHAPKDLDRVLGISSKLSDSLAEVLGQIGREIPAWVGVEGPQAAWFQSTVTRTGQTRVLRSELAGRPTSDASVWLIFEKDFRIAVADAPRTDERVRVLLEKNGQLGSVVLFEGEGAAEAAARLKEELGASEVILASSLEVRQKRTQPKTLSGQRYEFEHLQRYPHGWSLATRILSARQVEESPDADRFFVRAGSARGRGRLRRGAVMLESHALPCVLRTYAMLRDAGAPLAEIPGALIVQGQEARILQAAGWRECFGAIEEALEAQEVRKWMLAHMPSFVSEVFDVPGAQFATALLERQGAGSTLTLSPRVSAWIAEWRAGQAALSPEKRELRGWWDRAVQTGAFTVSYQDQIWSRNRFEREVARRFPLVSMIEWRGEGWLKPDLAERMLSAILSVEVEGN